MFVNRLMSQFPVVMNTQSSVGMSHHVALSARSVLLAHCCIDFDIGLFCLFVAYL